MENLHQRGHVLGTCKIGTRHGTSWGYSFSAVVAARVAADYARIGGALADIRGVLVHLAKSKAISSTIPQDYVVFTDGAKVRFEGVPTQLDLAAFVVAFVKTSKWLHVIPLGVIISEIVSDLEKLTTEETAA